MTKKLINPKLLPMTAAATVLSMLLVTGAVAESSVSTDQTSSVSAVKEPGALTTAPPQEVSTMSFGSNYKYLSSGSASASAISGSKVILDANTIASQNVDKVGFDLTLQHYTGTQWVDDKGQTFSKNSNSYITGNITFNVSAGYYYRAKCTHWVYQGTTYEQAITYSSDVLAYQ